ncbi:hypothetical protein HPB51_024172 [Rhipicephalus microplus]|uniref:Tc1-like transposase DDE domain-containing protein n=1 Tax=Rhipicephalus microplus TaxID=6941 RepID=A0A9J6DXE0_RHIMP|nr:hypothetical protein HPB51_024172 [Rhipicephalus microplus]
MASSSASSTTSPARMFSKLRTSKLSKHAKQVIANVYARTRMRFPEKSVREVLSVVSEDTGISPRTVAKLKAERLRGPLVSPKKRAREVKISSSRTVKHDSLTIHAFRLKVHSMYAKREIPTLDSVIRAANEDDDLPNFTKTTLWRLMKDIRFTFAKRKRNLALIERSDIIAWRRRYLRAIKKFRGQGRAHEGVRLAGHDCEVIARCLPQMSDDGIGCTLGQRGPFDPRTCWQQCNWFIEGFPDYFRAKKGGKADYHSEMDGRYFEEWFTNKLLPNIPPFSVIVMDNAPYHSVALEKAPTKSTRKADIQLWLTKKGVPWSEDMVRAELLELSQKVNTPSIVYRIDTLAATHGHEVLCHDTEYSVHDGKFGAYYVRPLEATRTSNLVCSLQLLKPCRGGDAGYVYFGCVGHRGDSYISQSKKQPPPAWVTP